MLIRRVACDSTRQPIRVVSANAGYNNYGIYQKPGADARGLKLKAGVVNVGGYRYGSSLTKVRFRRELDPMVFEISNSFQPPALLV